MDGGDDLREKALKLLEQAMKDKPQLDPRFQNDPRNLEQMIFQSSPNRESYRAKLHKFLQHAANMPAAKMQHPSSVPYDVNIGGAQRLGGGGVQMMQPHHMMSGDQQSIQQQSQTNATISTGPLAPQQQQHHHGMMNPHIDPQGRLLQPPPNPYTQQQMGGVLSSQQMVMSAGGMPMSATAQQGQQQPPHILQQSLGNRMIPRQGTVAGGRMGQPPQVAIMPEGQRYGMPLQERPSEFTRMNQPQRFQRPTIQQQVVPPQSMQPPPQWATSNVNTMMTPSAGGGPLPVSNVPTLNDTVVVTHVGPGMSYRQQPITIRSDPNVYQQQAYGGPRGGAIMTQHSSPSMQQPPQGITSAVPPPRYEQPPRMSTQQLYVNNIGGSQQIAGGPTIQPSTAGAPMMGPPAATVSSSGGGQYVPMSSPNAGNFMGPSPAVPAPTGPLPYAQEPSPVYAPARHNAPAEPSPAISQSTDTAVAEDPVYREKIQELQMYLEPLKRMLDQHQKEGDRNSPQSQKLLKIIDIIEGRSKATMDLLLKCEETLKRMVNKPAEQPKPTRESAICQPLFEVVASLAKAPDANETLKRVFRFPLADLSSAKRLCMPKYPDDPAPRTIESNFALKMAQLGCSPSPSVESAGKEKSPEPSAIPVSIQREVASLEPRFKIMLDRAAATSNGSKGDSSRAIHVICDLEDRRLPHVPSLRLQIPNDYPASGPKYDCNLLDYCGTPFFDNLREKLISRLTKLGCKCSITSLLDSWESTVRQSCVSQ